MSSSLRFRAVLMLSRTPQAADSRPCHAVCPAFRSILVLTLALAVSGCAAATAQRQARLAERQEDYDRAVVEYELAAELNPASGDIDKELRSTRTQLRNKVAVSHEGKTELETLIERA